ncbi:MAG: hypothetical protein RI891_804 [Gemmatimonadota bacterium]
MVLIVWSTNAGTPMTKPLIPPTLASLLLASTSFSSSCSTSGTIADFEME